MNEIKCGEIGYSANYKSLSKVEFENSCSRNPDYVLQKKYDGWFVAITPQGMFSKSGRLINKKIKSKNAEILIGEYLWGTSWAKKNHEFKKIIVHGSNTMNPFLPENCRWIENFNPFEFDNNFMTEFEGAILKNPVTGEFFRYKKEMTLDYVITTCIKTVNSEFLENAISGFELGLWDGEKVVPCAKVSSGINLKLRMKAFRHPKKFLGKIVEVTGNEIYETGALRHPRLKRFRMDKRKEHCGWKENS